MLLSRMCVVPTWFVVVGLVALSSPPSVLRALIGLIAVESLGVFYRMVAHEPLQRPKTIHLSAVDSRNVAERQHFKPLRPALGRPAPGCRDRRFGGQHHLRAAEGIERRRGDGCWPFVISSQSRHSVRTVRTKRSATAFAVGARLGVRTTCRPALRKTASNPPVNVRSRSRMRNRGGSIHSGRVHANWRACWVTHSGMGMARAARDVYATGRELNEEEHVTIVGAIWSPP